MVLTEKEKQILKTFEKVLPDLTEREKERLLWMGEGMTFKIEMMNKEKKAG